MSGSKLITCGFQSISKLDFRDSNLQKGRLLFNSNHVGQVREEFFSLQSIITGECLPQTSIKNPNYKINLELGNNRSVIRCYCTCKAGIDGNCKHVAAVYIYVNEYEEKTVTSSKQQWGIPTTKDAYSKGKRLDLLFPQPNNVPAPTIPDIQCSMISILQAEQKTDLEKDCKFIMDDVVSTVCQNELKEMLFENIRATTDLSRYVMYESRFAGKGLKVCKKHYKLSPHENEFYENLYVDVNQSVSFATSTVKQASNNLWHSIRHSRISSSICHQILTRKKDFEILAMRLKKNTFKGNAATEYGVKLEPAAKSSFAFKHNVNVVKCGVVVSPDFPWLCCSPDGLFRTPNVTLLEIKCPHSRKGQKIACKDNLKSFVPYLFYDGQILKLKQNHQYYTQIQVSMFILKIKSSILYVYSSVDQQAIKVNIDLEFLSSLLPKLQEFYFTYYLKSLCELTD